jgi:hypothetical protein
MIGTQSTFVIALVSSGVFVGASLSKSAVDAAFCRTGGKV